MNLEQRMTSLEAWRQACQRTGACSLDLDKLDILEKRVEALEQRLDYREQYKLTTAHQPWLLQVRKHQTRP